ARLLRLVDRILPEPSQQRHGLVVILPLDGVVDELFERLLVVTVLEDPQPLLAREIFVAQLRRIELRGLPPDRDPLSLVRHAVATSGEERGQLVMIAARD